MAYLVGRGFEVVKRLEGQDVRLPEVSTAKSAGYDFFAYEDVVIPPSLKISFDVGTKRPSWKFTPTLVLTGVKSYMEDDEALFMLSRSSAPKKLGLVVSNGIGLVDADYYGNSDNDGEIGFFFYNVLPVPVTIKKGDKLGQGVFQKFLRVNNHNGSEGSKKVRSGGFGSTGD